MPAGRVALVWTWEAKVFCPAMGVRLLGAGRLAARVPALVSRAGSRCEGEPLQNGSTMVWIGDGQSNISTSSAVSILSLMTLTSLCGSGVRVQIPIRIQRIRYSFPEHLLAPERIHARAKSYSILPSSTGGHLPTGGTHAVLFAYGRSGSAAVHTWILYRGP